MESSVPRRNGLDEGTKARVSPLYTTAKFIPKGMFSNGTDSVVIWELMPGTGIDFVKDAPV
jgi:hypothetical protein